MAGKEADSPELEFVDRGGDRLALHVYPEPEKPHAPLAVVWPAMGVKARYYRPFATRLRESGVRPVVVDLRGTGESTPRPGRRSRYGYAELADDVGTVLHALKPLRTDRRTLLVGHSLGGQACVLHLALQQPDAQGSASAHLASKVSTVDGLVLVAVGLPWWRLYRGGARQTAVLGYTQAINATSMLLRVWPGWTFGGRQARGVIRDWAYTARHGDFPHLGGLDVEQALGSVTTPVLAVSVDHDRYTPPETTDQLVAKLAAAPVERVHYRQDEAEGPLDHFLWVRASAHLATRISAFAAG